MKRLFNQNLSENEVYYTNSFMPLAKYMLCSKLYDQKVLNGHQHIEHHPHLWQTARPTCPTTTLCAAYEALKVLKPFPPHSTTTTGPPLRPGSSVWSFGFRVRDLGVEFSVRKSPRVSSFRFGVWDLKRRVHFAGHAGVPRS